MITYFRRNLASATPPRWRLHPPWLRARRPHHQHVHHYLLKPRCHLPCTRHPRTLVRTTRRRSARPTTTRRSLHRLPATMPHRHRGPHPSTHGPVSFRHGHCRSGIPQLLAFSALGPGMYSSRCSQHCYSSPTPTLSTASWQLFKVFHHQLSTPTTGLWTQVSVHTWPTTLVSYALPPHLPSTPLLSSTMAYPYLFIALDHL
jgi:hypothetical protein